MTDTPLTISIPSPLADDVRAAAEKHGLTPAEYLSQEMAESISAEAFADDDLSWEEDIRRLEEARRECPSRRGLRRNPSAACGPPDAAQMKRIELRPAARRDMLRLEKFLHKKSPGAALRALDTLTRRILILAEHPPIGVEREGGFRRKSDTHSFRYSGRAACPP